MSKIAIAFHGLSNGANEKGFNTSLNKDTFENFKANLFEDEDCDVYFHTWKSNFENNIVKEYTPKKYIFENATKFKKSIMYKLETINASLDNNISNFTSNIDTLYSFYSRFYSLYKSIELIDNIEDYKLIIISRFDLVFLNKIDLNKYADTYSLLVNNFANFLKLDGNIQATLDGITSNFNQNVFHYGVHDYFFCGCPKVIKEFSRMYLYLDLYFEEYSHFYFNKWPRLFSGHSICSYHLKTQKIPIIYTNYEEDKDFKLIRNINCENHVAEDTLLTLCEGFVNKMEYNKAIEILSDNKSLTPNIHNRIGYIYYKYIKDVEEAIKHYKKSFNLQINCNSLQSLCVIYNELEEHIECLFYCNEFLKYFKNAEVQKLFNKNLTQLKSKFK